MLCEGVIVLILTPKDSHSFLQLWLWSILVFFVELYNYLPSLQCTLVSLSPVKFSLQAALQQMWMTRTFAQA